MIRAYFPEEMKQIHTAKWAKYTCSIIIIIIIIIIAALIKSEGRLWLKRNNINSQKTTAKMYQEMNKPRLDRIL